MVDVLFGFHIGIVLTKSLHTRLVLDGALVARLYTKHSTFAVDVIAALPLPLEVIHVSRMPTRTCYLQKFMC